MESRHSRVRARATDPSTRAPWHPARLGLAWSPASWTQLILVATAVLVTAAMVTVAQLSRERAQRHEQIVILAETVRADAQNLNAIRAQTLADVEMNHRRIVLSPGTVVDGLAAWSDLHRALTGLGSLDRPLANRLSAESVTLLELGQQTYRIAAGQRFSAKLVRAQRLFATVVGKLDTDALNAATSEQHVADRATTNADDAFIGSLVVGLLALLLIAIRFHRLRRKLALDAAQATMEAYNEARLRALLEQSSDIVTVVGTDLRVRWQAASITRILGHGAETLIGRRLTALVHPEEIELVEQFLATCLTSSSIQSLTIRMSHADGSWRTIDAVANNRVADPAIGGLVLSMRDATDRKSLEDQLRHQAYHDSLTGLANRSLFENRLSQAVAIAERSGRAFAVLFVDLDDFKTINDSLGHAHGDDLLREVAARVGAILRPTDTAARLGGDEFAVLLEIADHTLEAQVVAERILEELSYPFAIGDRELRVTASVGLAVTSEAVTVDELLRNADIAMYAAKADGGAAVRRFENDMHDRAVERLELTGELREALESEQFVLEYQPIVELDAGRIVGVEALVRWDHPRRRRVGPDQFIGLSEDTGLIVPLGRWILETACAQSRRWQRAHPELELQLSVNVSTRQLREPEFVDSVLEILQRTGLPSTLLTLEITEGVLVGDRDAVVGRLRELRALGVRIAIDDFGTGYSSLSHLRHLPVDTLKIDKSFIDGIDHDPEKAKLVRGIVNLGESLQLAMVAEGIERPEQLSELLGGYQPLAQGFLFHRPLPAAEIDRLLELGVDASAFASTVAVQTR